MIPVFIGGSRAISRLNAAIRQKLDEIIARGHPVLIGDANGADKAVQRYLADRRYENVTVFCSLRCRNNIGGWTTRVVDPGRSTRGFAFYAAKDRAMSREAGCGVMLWDGASRGTYENATELLSEGKKVLVYSSRTRSFFRLETRGDLAALAQPTAPVRRRRSASAQLRLG